ncbi:hypothetical protein [Brevibacillus laterosporus]|uniref:hypothetical protein n=1 Tax=Brevibacillus laterosporus TaxID=1465 RepID=UPI002656742E|nr:hypothetical protein [Brevibacillus laterosporus]MDN9008612.1 hypothetical protein [Brevibacillus laterosporus]MDO0939698.1 hypothetical protein [Brevibacillus laterosporus]
MALLLKILLPIGCFFLCWYFMSRLFHPLRAFRQARRKGTFHLLDTPTNIRQNLLLTYKKAVYEGEKYSEPGKPSHVNWIVLTLTKPTTEELLPIDYDLMESRLHEHYPQAQIQWPPCTKRNSL